MVGQSMVRNLLSEANLEDLTPLLTPALFRVISVRSVLAEIGRIYSSRKQAETLRSDLGSALESRDFGVALKVTNDAQPLALNMPQAKLHGERILRLYFFQILSCDTAFVDLRPSALFGSDQLEYQPARAVVFWDPAFINPLREVYRGFYSSDRDRYVAGMTELNLGPAADTFERHFGGSDQSAVGFQTKKLVSTLSQVFQVCREHGLRVHPNFVPFGVILAGLYQSLELLGELYDVGSAFSAVNEN